MTQYFLGLIQGILIGAGGILPGISGASLAVVFGVYEDFTALIAHPRRHFKSFIARRSSLCIGIGAGFILFTLLLNLIFERYTVILVFLFIGFIAGTLPGIYTTAKSKGLGPWEGIAFFGILGLMLTLAFFLPRGDGTLFNPTQGASTIPGLSCKWLLAGAAIGAGSLLPGVSASFILIFFGLYGPLLEAVRGLHLLILAQLGLGALGALLALSRLVNWLYEHFHGPVSFGVLAFTLGSLFLVFPGFPEGSLILPSALACLGGFGLSLALSL
jgi:putative membrane protein